MSFRNQSFFLKAALAALVVTALAGCDDDIDTGPGSGAALTAAVAASSYDGGSCTLVDASGRSLASPAAVQAGSARFYSIGTTAGGLALLSCSGGTYTDAATGSKLAAPTLRAWTAAATKPGATAVVTPLTEIAVRVLGDRSAENAYATVLAQVGRNFGLAGVDLGAVVPTDLSTQAATGSDASRHGLALAALAQLQSQGKLGKSADAVLDALAANIDAYGYPKDAGTTDLYVHALEATLDNARLKANLGDPGMTLAVAAIQQIDSVNPLASIDYVETDLSPTRSEESHVLAAGSETTLLIGGRNLGINMDVRLGGKACRLHDLEDLDEESESDQQELFADCPAQPAGAASLVVRDAGIVVSQTRLDVTTQAASASRKRAQSVAPAPAGGNGPATVSGSITAQAPTIGTPTSRGGHDYSRLRSFPVRGVVVELLDRGAQDAVLMQTSTDANGRYAFAGVDAGRRVVVRAKAQLLKTRAAGQASGAQWNLTVRDNTSTTSPKALYALDSAEALTADGQQTVDLVATVGFNADGSPLSDSGAERRSAPFSILEVAYSAMTKIEASDANVVFPDVNIYWSPKNTTASGGLERGDIGTSHYSSGGTLPGVFILGKADVDTDEFDQGVIGHEFGHWLQSVQSFSDNPGGSHASTDFKDASLAYGEGYGTAVGGLLTGNPLYIDTSGPKQAAGGVTDLDAPTAAGVRKGFYSEESVGYVLYQMGKRFGFTPFWRAVTSMKEVHYSATIFAFLERFVSQNPSATISDLLTAENLRSTDPLGNLPAGTAPDPAIAAAANKGQAPNGADDLETLYLPIELAAGAAPATAAVAVAPNAPAFCVNHNLPGAQKSNGLGMLRRFTVKANFTGSLGVKALDSAGNELDSKNYTVQARSSKGQKLSIYGWSEGNASYITVEEGVTYTVRFQRDNADVPLGSQCGNRLSLWRLPA